MKELKSRRYIKPTSLMFLLATAMSLQLSFLLFSTSLYLTTVIALLVKLSYLLLFLALNLVEICSFCVVLGTVMPPGIVRF